ncbi:MAG: metal-dependent transcriptional regulator [Candidatus Dormibacteraeota bacterium]|nr:metal-dependent transcriptional regulator [Candidatus Dormibacteraeota bacterium]MBV9525138.1 metal-dependent transcriptional regulator [Candidatus Dormibacteraeota bacterium]
MQGRRQAKAPEARSPAAERYLEAIYYIEHEGEVARPGRLAEWLGVSAPTVSVSLQRLVRDGWVQVAADRSVALTDAGETAAADIVRRHRIVERWLTDALGMDWTTADREAAVLAHGMTTTVLDRLDAHLGHPATCPHGNVIPGRRPPKGGPLRRLVELAAGDRAAVARISEVAEHEAPQLLRVLGGAGLTPGVEVEVRAAGPRSWRVATPDGDVELDRAIAAAVWVTATTARRAA